MDLQTKYFDMKTKLFVENKDFEGYKIYLENLAEKALNYATNEHIDLCFKLIEGKDFERYTEIFQKIF